MQDSVNNVSEIKNLKLNNTTTNATFQQQLGNLPEELLSQPRFFQLYGKNKGDTPKGWSNPDNQKLYTDFKGDYPLGFDTAGHGRAIDYVLFDFDHVLDDNGNWVNQDAEKLFNWITSNFATYCELSQSKHGVHIIAIPTEGKFEMYSGGTRGTLYFDGGGEDTKLEIFYLTKSRYCLFTGNLYHCEPKAPIAHGEAVDGVFQAILEEIAEQAKKTAQKDATQPKPTERKKHASTETLFETSTDYDAFRAGIMLDAINPADLADTDWLAAISSAKHIGISYNVVDQWNQRDPDRYNEEENKKRWDSLTDPSFNIETLHGIAKRFGYSEKDTQREWYRLHPELSKGAATMNNGQQHESFIWTQDKVKSCPVNLRLPSGFTFDQSGITKILPPKKETDPPKYIRACRAPIVPTKKFREPIKGTLEYGVAILSDGNWRNIEIDGATVGDIRELSKILNRHGGLVDEPKIVSQFINATVAINPDMKRIKSYNQTGWTSEDYDDFAFPSADGNAVVRRVGYDYERIFKPKGNPEEWKKKFLEIDKQAGAIGHVIIGGACSAPVIKPLQDLPNLQIHVYGKKSIGKTPMLKFAESIFGDTDVGALTHTFAATPKSRLETACAFNDLPLICEELESIGAKDTEKLSTDIYNFYLGIGGQALNKDGTKRDPKLFNSVRLTSGEHSLVPRNGNGGEFKRALELRCVTLLDEDFAADLYGFCKRNHGLFGEQWISYVIDNWQLISKHYHRTFDTVKAAQVKGYENDLTQLRTLIISLVDYQHFKICIGLSDLATDADKINAEIVADINAVIAQLPTADEIDDTTRAIEFLMSFYVANLKHFTSEVNKPEFDNEFSQGALECFGKDFKNGEVAFLPHILNRILTEDGGFKSAEKLIAEFYDKGYLRHSYGLNTYPTKINGKTVRAIRFKSGIITTAEEDNEADATA